jgi:inorganic pyrophosphatase/exopolyphosphatase
MVTSSFPGLRALKQDLSSYPKINAICDAVAALPKVLGYNAKEAIADAKLAGKLKHANPQLHPSPLDHAIVKHSSAADDLLKHMTSDEKEAMEELSTNQALGYLRGCAFVGHTNTDMDSIGSAYGASKLFGGTFTRASDINTESKFALERWGIEVPPLFQDTDEKTQEKVCLVDHNQTTQMACGIVQKNIRGIIDHHAIQGNCVTTPGPIYINIQPWGSACSIVANMYVELGKEMDRQTAGILLSGILSDTLNLRSPTTTDPDRLMAALLCKISGVEDANGLAKQLFKAKSKMCTALTAYQLLNGDLKAFNYKFNFNGTVLFGVVEAESSNLEALKKSGKVDEIRKEMRVLKQEQNARLCFFALVDIFAIKSELVIIRI